MEEHFGRDFSRVRVHADPEAAASARALDSSAYAVGAHLVFGEGKYQPSSTVGRRLLAHELAHAVQQEMAAHPPSELVVAPDDDHAEREARDAGERALEAEDPSARLDAGGPTPLAFAPRAEVVVQRQKAPSKGIPADWDDPAIVKSVRERMAKERSPEERERLRKWLIDTISGRDAILFLSRLNSLTFLQRENLRADPEFLPELRKYLWGYALWSVRLTLEYGGDRPVELRLLSNAIFSRDWQRTRALLVGFDSLRRVPGLREVIAEQFTHQQALGLWAIVNETQSRAEAPPKSFEEAHYEDKRLQRFEGTRAYELLRTPQEARVVVRIWLIEDPMNTKPVITDELLSRWEQRIAGIWNGRLRLRSGGKTLELAFVPLFVYGPDIQRTSVHHTVKVTAGDGRSDEGNWYAEQDSAVAAHEFGHMLGLPDEYWLPGSIAEIPPSLGLSPEEARRSSWEGITGTKAGVDTSGHSIVALMGKHYESTAVLPRYGSDIVATFNANLRLPGEPPWVVEARR